MYRAIPSANKILSAKWQNQEHTMHMKNLQNIKGTVDSREPPKFQHLKKKYKKTQQLEERYTEIERENRILLEKMTNILQKQRKEVYTANAVTIGDRSTLGTGNRSLMMSTANAVGMLAPLTASGARRSLNRDARKRELMKITKENQLILKRLQDKSANYNVSKWQKNEDERKKVLKNICEYPLIEKEGYQGQPDFIIKRKTKSTSVGNAFYKRTKGYTSGQNQMQPQYSANQIIKKSTLYTGEHELGNGFYHIEMLISQTDDLVISAQHTELPDSFIIEIEFSKVEHLINEFNNDYSLMADHLKIMNKRMVLLNPKFVNKEEGQEENVQQEQNEAGGDQQAAIDEPQLEEKQNDNKTDDDYTEPGASQVPLPAAEAPAVIDEPAESGSAKAEQPTTEYTLPASNMAPESAANLQEAERTPAVEAPLAKTESVQEIQEPTPKTAKDDKIETAKPSPAANDAKAPDTAESAKVKASTIAEKPEVRQSQEVLVTTNKAEGEKKIGLAEDAKAETVDGK